MKKNIIVILLGLVITIFPSIAIAWECGSSSESGYGLGFSSSESLAKDIALNECRKYTPSGQKCYIDYCNDDNDSGSSNSATASSVVESDTRFVPFTVTVISDAVQIKYTNNTAPLAPDSVPYKSFSVSKGYPLLVYAKYEGGAYAVKDFEGKTGTVDTRVVTESKNIITSSGSVKLRSSPSTKGKVVANVERGVVFTKIGQTGEWVNVKHEAGTEGWVWQELIWPSE